MKLADKVAIITGADGAIGTATALRFAREGAAIVLNDFAATHLERVAAEITEVEGCQALISLGDVSRPAHVDRMLREATDALGRIDILVNVAGRDSDATVQCALLCAERVLPAMRARGAGRVLNVATTGSLETDHAGLIALTRKLALEVASDGVTVNCVVPGAVEAREIAAALVFFASDEALHVTGQILHVDGGLSVTS